MSMNESPSAEHADDDVRHVAPGALGILGVLARSERGVAGAARADDFPARAGEVDVRDARREGLLQHREAGLKLDHTASADSSLRFTSPALN